MFLQRSSLYSVLITLSVVSCEPGNSDRSGVGEEGSPKTPPAQPDAFSEKSSEPEAWIDRLRRLRARGAESSELEMLVRDELERHETLANKLAVVDQLVSEENQLKTALLVELLTGGIAAEELPTLRELFGTPSAGDALTLSAGSLSQVLIELDPQQAFDVVGSVPDAQVQSVLRDTFFRRWISESPDEAADFINQREPSPDFDVAIADYVTRSKRQDPEASMGWAVDIFDPELRTSAINEVSKVWQQIDSNGLLEWRETWQNDQSLDSSIGR